MKETQIRIVPSFFTRSLAVDRLGKTSMEVVGTLPKGGRVRLTLDEMPHWVVKQVVKDGLRVLQMRRDRALQDVDEMRHAANL